MADYLTRYQQGERQEVWQELAALGDQIRAEPLYSEARAVAQETMRRARHNIDLLVERLREIGYQFANPNQAFIPTSAEQLEQLDALEREVGPIPLSVRAWVEQIGAVDLRGNYPRLSYHTTKFRLSGKMEIGRQDRPGADVVDIASVDLDAMYDDLEAADAIPQEVKDTFMNFRGFFNQIFAEEDDDEEADMPEEERAISDPLVVDLHELSLEESVEYEEWLAYGGHGTYAAYIAPDREQKSDMMGGEGGCEIHLPNAAIDAPLLYTDFGDLPFVEYLRLSFEWAGFPGLRDFDNRDEALLARLKEGLLPL